MVLRYLVEIVNVELAIVLHLGVVEEIPFHPGARRRLAGFGAEFVDDAGDGHELHHVGIADENFVEQGVAGRVIVAVDEAGHDGHLPGVERLGRFADERFDVGVGSDGGEPAGFDRERLRLRCAGIDRVDFGVEDDEIGVLRFGGCRRLPEPWCAEDAGDAGSGQAHEFSTAVVVILSLFIVPQGPEEGSA